MASSQRTDASMRFDARHDERLYVGRSALCAARSWRVVLRRATTATRRTRDALDRSADERAVDRERRAGEAGVHRDARRTPTAQTRDVTDEVRSPSIPRFGTFTGPTLRSIDGRQDAGVRRRTTTRSATAQVIARLEDDRASIRRCRRTRPICSTAPEDPARAPTVVYPPVDVVMPRNLGDFEAHWTDAHGNNVFEVSLKTEFADVRVYVPGGNGDPVAGPAVVARVPRGRVDCARSASSRACTYQVRGVDVGEPGRRRQHARRSS